MTQFELGTDCQTQLAYAQTQIETLQMHKETLRRERDEARAEIDQLIAQLSSADKSREATEDRLNRLESALASTGIHPVSGDYAAAIDAIRGDLAVARAEVESCRKAYAEIRSTEDEWKRDTLAAHRAEVERLRPAAEAWEALEAWRIHDGRDQVGLAKLYERRIAAAARARAAKEPQSG